MSRTDRVWNHADDAFKSADKAFEEAERIFSELPKGTTHYVKSDTDKKVHTLKFEARSVKERWRLTKKFFRMGWGVLLTGKTELQFKDRA